jgi:hypothetical protein
MHLFYPVHSKRLRITSSILLALSRQHSHQIFWFTHLSASSKGFRSQDEHEAHHTAKRSRHPGKARESKHRSGERERSSAQRRSTGRASLATATSSRTALSSRSSGSITALLRLVTAASSAGSSRGSGCGTARRLGIRHSLVADRRQRCIGRDCPSATGEVRAWWRSERGFVVVCANASRGERGPMLAEILEIRADGLWCTTSAELCVVAGGCCGASFEVVGDKTVLVRFLDPFVDDGAGPGVDHLLAKDCCLVVKSSWRFNNAASLGEEDRDVVLRCVHLKEDVSGRVVCCFAAPV